jgi:hypothetical protein
MANEITITQKLSVSNGGYAATFDSGSLKRDQAAIGAHAPVISVGTSEETISAGDVSTLGYVAFKNLDAANYVDIGPDSTGLVGFIRLEPGDCAIFRLKPGITIKAQANTAAVKLQMLLLED